MGQFCCKEGPNEVEPSPDKKKVFIKDSILKGASTLPPDTSVPSLALFSLQRSLGKGAFGKVRVVQHVYALKYINKAKCIQMRAVENIIQERRLLEEISSLFVVNMRYAFQDAENMFMVIDLMTGGDLRFHLDQTERLNENAVRFYIAEMSVGISTLHSRSIVHRDLKPDNVLLDSGGHAHLTDFNIAVHFSPEKPMFSVAGSMAYMAPEILTKVGYLSSIDWWSLGVIMYELVFGFRPFRGKSTEALVSTIIAGEVIFPPEAALICSQDCLDCINAFLTKDVSKRLGVAEMGGFESLKKHPFFKSLNWNQLESKNAKPPFVPESKKANCDATFELDGLLLDDNPLQNKPKKVKAAPKSSIRSATGNSQNDSAESPALDFNDLEIKKQIAIIEQRFTSYDFEKAKPWSASQYDLADNFAAEAGSVILSGENLEAENKCINKEDFHQTSEEVHSESKD